MGVFLGGGYSFNIFLKPVRLQKNTKCFAPVGPCSFAIYKSIIKILLLYSIVRIGSIMESIKRAIFYYVADNIAL